MIIINKDEKTNLLFSKQLMKKMNKKTVKTSMKNS